MVWSRRNAPVVLLAAALLAAALSLVVLTRHLTYFQDTWEFLINRRQLSVDSLLKPHNEHIVLLPVAIEIFILNVFGMSSALPEYLLLIAMLMVSAGLLFVYVRRRLGPWLALMASLLLLCLGPAWQDILWPFELAFVGSILFGIAMLLALDREDSRGDLIACVCLAIASSFSSLGISFMAAAAVNLFVHRRERGWRRAWFVAVPVVLFGLWYLGWGHNAESHLGLRNVLDSPHYVVEGLAASVESLLGLSNATVEGPPAPILWGAPLLLVIVGLVVYRQTRRPGFPPTLWPVLAALAVNWFLTAFNYIPGREPTATRYMYAAGAFALLVAAELFRDVRFSRRGLAIAGAVTVAAAASNLHLFHDGRNWLLNQTVLTRSDLAAIEIAHRTVDPGFELAPQVAGTPSLIDVFAGKYLEAEAEFGSPAYSVSELEAAPEVGRKQADIVLSQALPLSTVTETGAMDEGGSCVLAGGEGAPADVPVGPGVTRIVVSPGPHASFSLRRFAIAEYGVSTAGAPGESTTRLTVPADTSRVPWHLKVEAEQPVRVCR